MERKKKKKKKRRGWKEIKTSDDVLQSAKSDHDKDDDQ
jgi:hypothetical protein